MFENGSQTLLVPLSFPRMLQSGDPLKRKSFGGDKSSQLGSGVKPERQTIIMAITRQNAPNKISKVKLNSKTWFVWFMHKSWLNNIFLSPTRQSVASWSPVTACSVAKPASISSWEGRTPKALEFDDKDVDGKGTPSQMTGNLGSVVNSPKKIRSGVPAENNFRAF